MKIARYWARGHAEFRDSCIARTVTSWRWSEVSQAEANLRANEAAQNAARRIASGEPLPTGYNCNRVWREEILNEISDNNGLVIALVTRNVHGALILNTRDLMFIDVDSRFERADEGSLSRAFELLESNIRSKITALSNIRGYSVKLYQTFAGFRCVIINRRIAPESIESRLLFRMFDADPRYIQLCRNQESYHARLTPKYWRCGVRKPPSRFPWSTKAEEQDYRRWEKEYEKKASFFATCRLIEQIGIQEGDPELMTLMKLHDHVTRATSGLTLA